MEKHARRTSTRGLALSDEGHRRAPSHADGPGAFRFVVVAALLVIGLASFFWAGKSFSSPETYVHQIEQLDKKKETVMSLSVASATASAAISLLPDDTCTPIAEQLADISKDFTLLLGVILLEKYLLTVFGFAFYRVIVPLCCAAGIVVAFMRRGTSTHDHLRAAAVRLLVMGFIVWASIPTSVFVTDMIEDTYQSSIAAAVEAAEQASSMPEETSGEQAAPTNIGEWVSQKVEEIGSAFGTVTATASGLLDWAKSVLSNFAEALAVMAVTTCVIPLLVPLLAFWMVKTMLESSQASVYVDSEALRVAAHAEPAEPRRRRALRAPQDEGE